MSLDNLKLSKSLTSAMLEAGYISPSEIQAKTISRILGGQNILAVGPAGTGKTTASVFSVLMRLKGPADGAPRALMVVPSREKAVELEKLFRWHGKNTGIRVASLAAGGLQGDQSLEAIEDGMADIVIGTPERINALYVKSLLNLRSLTMIVVDDAETVVKLNQQATVYNLAEGLTKCQRIVFTQVLNEKLNRLTEHLMPVAELIKVEKADPNPGTIPMVLYKVSNFKTKLNLLELIVRDSGLIKKAVVFVNTRQTAETLYNNLRKRIGKSICRLNVGGFDSVELFKESSEARVMVLSGEDQPSFNLFSVPYIFHMEIPEDKSIFIKRVRKLAGEVAAEAVAITFATNQELPMVGKIEQLTGQKMKEEKLPQELTAEEDTKTESSGNEADSWDWKIK